MLLETLEVLGGRFTGCQAILLDVSGPTILQGAIHPLSNTDGQLTLRWLWCATKADGAWTKVKRPKVFKWRLEGVNLDDQGAVVVLTFRNQPNKSLTLLPNGHPNTLAETAVTEK